MNWSLFFPELHYFAFVMILLVLAMVPRLRPRTLYNSALALSALGVVICLASVRQEGMLFMDTYRVDLFSQVCKALLSMGLFLVICVCSELSGVEQRWHAEFYLLLFTSTLAMLMLASAVHLVNIYVTLELSSYSLYLMVSMRRQKGLAMGAGMHYFLIGVASSAVMLFGMALLYGAAGTLYLDELLRQLPAAVSGNLLTLALLLTFCGFFFKLALFPLHIWAPDVYQGAPNQLAAFIATASKVAAVAVLLRVAASTIQDNRLMVDLLVGLSIISMTVGNLAAIAQRDFKRQLAYSSIAHAGYVLIGILCVSLQGTAASLFYALALVIMKFTIFLVLIKVAADGRNLSIEGLAGLHRRSPLMAMALMLALFGLAGIPPTVGFTAKLLVFTAAIQKGYLILVLIAMFNVVISLYYYISAIKAAYLLEPPPGGHTAALALSAPTRLLTALLIVVMVAAGIFPNLIIDLANQAAAGIF